MRTNSRPKLKVAQMTQHVAGMARGLNDYADLIVQQCPPEQVAKLREQLNRLDDALEEVESLYESMEVVF